MNDENFRNLDDRLARMEKSINKMSILLTGNGSPERGFVVRVDRLERAVKVVSWVTALVVTSVVTAAVAAGFRY